MKHASSIRKMATHEGVLLGEEEFFSGEDKKKK